MKKYTDRQYADMVSKANEEGKMLYVKNGELEINIPGYYICEPHTNITDGTINPNLKALQNDAEICRIKEELFQLDQKRIRAMCEPELKNAEDGATWLEYYNSQIAELREKLNTLL